MADKEPHPSPNGRNGKLKIELSFDDALKLALKTPPPVGKSERPKKPNAA